jgi:hypothetical protein
LVWLDSATGEPRGAPWPLTGVQEWNDDAWDSHVSFSRGPPRFANLVIRSDRHTGYLDAPDVLGEGPENVLDLPYGLSIVGLDFTPAAKRVVIDGDLVVLGNAVAHGPGSSSSAASETAAARQARIAYSVASAYGACTTDSVSPCGQNDEIPWRLAESHLARTGSLLASNGDVGIVLNSNSHVFTAKTPGMYCVCIHALGTSRANIDTEFEWALRCTAAGQSTPKSIVPGVGASGVYMSLAADDTFVMVSRTNATVTFAADTELRIQMVSALVPAFSPWSQMLSGVGPGMPP